MNQANRETALPGGRKPSPDPKDARRPRPALGAEALTCILTQLLPPQGGLCALAKGIKGCWKERAQRVRQLPTIRGCFEPNPHLQLVFTSGTQPGFPAAAKVLASQGSSPPPSENPKNITFWPVRSVPPKLRLSRGDPALG